MKKIIIVGNGKEILKNKNGSLIDSFDIVVRCNKFKLLDPYTEFTGLKTDFIFCCCANLFRFFESDDYQVQVVMKMYEDFLNYYKLKDTSLLRKAFFDNFYYQKENFNVNKKILCFLPSNESKNYNNNKLTYLSEDKIFSNKIIENKHTTGFKAINFFKNYFSSYELYITGFDSFLKSYCYWEKPINNYLTTKILIKVKTNNYKNHPYLNEYILIKQMIKEGSLKLISSLKK